MQFDGREPDGLRGRETLAVASDVTAETLFVGDSTEYLLLLALNWGFSLLIIIFFFLRSRR